MDSNPIANTVYLQLENPLPLFRASFSGNIFRQKLTVLLMKALQYLLIPLQVILADGCCREGSIGKIKAKSGYIIQIIIRNGKKDKNFEPIHKDGLLNVLSPGLITTGDYAEIMGF